MPSQGTRDNSLSMRGSSVAGALILQATPPMILKFYSTELHSWCCSEDSMDSEGDLNICILKLTWTPSATPLSVKRTEHELSTHHPVFGHAHLRTEQYSSARTQCLDQVPGSSAWIQSAAERPFTGPNLYTFVRNLRSRLSLRCPNSRTTGPNREPSWHGRRLDDTCLMYYVTLFDQ